MSLINAAPMRVHVPLRQGKTKKNSRPSVMFIFSVVLRKAGVKEIYCLFTACGKRAPHMVIARNVLNL